MIGVALLGCGRIGRVHAANVAAHPKAELVRVFDPVREALAAVVERWGGEPAGSAAEAIGDPRVDAVIVATSTDTHVELIEAAVRAGRRVFCEKPVDLDLARAEGLAARLGREVARRVMVGFNRRFDPHFRALRARLPGLGRLQRLRITSFDPAPPPADYIRRSGGLFRDMTIHDFDMARFLLPEEPVRLFASGTVAVDPAIRGLGDVDTATVVLETASGVQAVIENCRRAVYGYDQRIEVLGERGLLRADNPLPTTVEHWDAQGVGRRDPLLPFFLERYAEAYRAELDAFLDAIGRDAPVSPDLHDGLAAQRLAEAALVSLEERRVVELEAL